MAPQELKNISSKECAAETLSMYKRLSIRNDYSEFHWNEHLQSYILTASYIGMLLFQIPSGILATRMSAKLLMLAGVGINALFTLLTPLCVSGHGAAIIFIVFRIIIGAAEATVLSGYTEMLLCWFPASERTGSLALVTSGVQVGSENVNV